MNITQVLDNYILTDRAPTKLLHESPDNIVYIVGEKNKIIIRISKRLSAEDIEFEYNAIKHLSKKNIPVPLWIKTSDKKLYVKFHNNITVMFEYINGKGVDANRDHLPTSKQSYEAGSCLGLLANAAMKFKPNFQRSRTIYSELERAVALENIFINKLDDGKVFIKQVKEAINFGKRQDENTGLIHNDFRPSNILFDKYNKVVGIIDFDWSCIGPIIKDLALALVEWSFPDGAKEPNMKIFESFLCGYNSVSVKKFNIDTNLYSWIKFACLSDASTYFCDLFEKSNTTKQIVDSHMYRKFLYFSKNNLLY